MSPDPFSATDNTTIYFLKDLISGKKKCKSHHYITNLSLDVKCHELKHLYVPQYETLALAHIYEFIDTRPQIHAYFCDTKELKKMIAAAPKPK